MPHPNHQPKAHARTARKSAEKRGRMAERIATIWLQLKGYRLLELRFRTKVGEIDLIAEKHGTVVFIEVKRRKTVANALEAVSHHQRRRIEAAAQLYLQHRIASISDKATNKAANTQANLSQTHNTGTICRFDVIAIAPWSIPVHIKGAWRMGI